MFAAPPGLKPPLQTDLLLVWSGPEGYFHINLTLLVFLNDFESELCTCYFNFHRILMQIMIMCRYKNHNYGKKCGIKCETERLADVKRGGHRRLAMAMVFICPLQWQKLL